MTRRALIINGYNTATDGRMTLTALQVETPKYRAVTQVVPGMDGALDYSDAANGRTSYETRKLTASLESSEGSCAERQKRFDAFIRHCNGRRCKIISPDHPDGYYIGRVQASIDFNNLAYGQISISAVCEPWRYSAVPCMDSVPVLGLSSDALITAEITYMEDASTCDAASYAVSTSMIAGNFSMRAAEIRSSAVWRIAVDPNTDYFVAARIRDGRGAWGCAAAMTAENWTHGAVRTGDDGYLYFRLENYSTSLLIATPVVVIPAKQLYLAHNGSAPAIASVKFSAASDKIDATSVAVCAGNDMTVLQNSGVWEVDLPPDDFPLLLYTWQTETNGQTVPVVWTRGDF